MSACTLTLPAAQVKSALLRLRQPTFWFSLHGRLLWVVTMHSRLRLFAPWLIIALLFSNIATAAMWCCQSGNHHQQSKGLTLAMDHAEHQTHTSHPMHTDQTASNSTAGDHQTDCPLCASGCHSALVIPLSDFTEFNLPTDSKVSQEPTGTLSFFPHSRYRPPIA